MWTQVLLIPAVLVSFMIGQAYSDASYPMNSGNPCDVVRCKGNTTCVAIFNPEKCQAPETCEMMPMCVPIGPNPLDNPPVGPVCGEGRCQPGEKCDYVQVYCITTPCPPILMCVPIGGEPVANTEI